MVWTKKRRIKTTGRFHQFGQWSDGTRAHPVAIVELQDGKVITAELHEILHFNDVPDPGGRE